MNIKTIFTYLLIIPIFAICVSCDEKKDGISNADRNEINKELQSLRNHLPLEIPGMGVKVTSAELEDSCVTFTYLMSSEAMEMIFSVDSINSDRNIPRLLSGFEPISEDFISKNVGIKFRIVNADNGQEYLKVEVGPKKLKDIMSKINSGKIQPYTLVEVYKMHAANMQFPIDIGEGLWLTNIYVDGNNLCYEYIGENDNIFDKEFESAMKEDIIRGLREDPSMQLSQRREEIVKENIHFVYIYKDKNGKTISKIDIGPHDIF